MNVASIQRPVERALKEFFTGKVPDGYTIVCAHDVELLPQEGNYLAIICSPGNWEEYIDNAETRVEFRIATQVAEADQRVDRTDVHQKATGIVHDLLSWGNFDDALTALNAQGTTADGIVIGFSGWEQASPPMPGHTETQIVTTLPYDFIAFIADAES